MTDRPFTHFVGVGACYIDTILTVPAYPFEDAKQRASSLSRRRGGNCPNTLEVLQQLYHTEATVTTTTTTSNKKSSGSTPLPNSPSLYLLSALPCPSSQDTQFIHNSFNLDPPVNVSHALYRPSATAASSYVIKSQCTNSRTIVNHNPLTDITLEEFQSAFTSLSTQHPDARFWVHFEGRTPTTTRECIDWLRRDGSEDDGDCNNNNNNNNNITISVECEKPRRPGLSDLAERADVVFYSRSWAEGQGYTGASECICEEAMRISEARGPSQGGSGAGTEKVVLCCTWGERGAAVVDFEPGFGLGRVGERAAWVTDKGQLGIVDTVGAGDTWIAGMVFGFMSRTDWETGRRVEFANELAGRKITREGFGGLGEQMKESME